MIDDAPSPLYSPAQPDPFATTRTLVAILVTIGVCSGLVGAAVGLRMAFEATGIDCAGRAGFRPGTTDHCFAHQHAGDGTAIVAISVLLTIVVILCGVIAHSIVAQRRQAA